MRPSSVPTTRSALAPGRETSLAELPSCAETTTRRLNSRRAQIRASGAYPQLRRAWLAGSAQSETRMTGKAAAAKGQCQSLSLVTVFASPVFSFSAE